MTKEKQTTRFEFLRGEKKALEEASLGSGFYSIESAKQLEREEIIEVCDSVILTGQVIIDEFVKPTRKKLRHRGTTTTTGIQECKEVLPQIKPHLENFEQEIKELIALCSNSSDELKLPETHLEMLERYTLLSHESIILKAQLSQAQSDLNYMRGELREDG